MVYLSALIKKKQQTKANSEYLCQLLKASVMLESSAPEYACLMTGALKLFWSVWNKFFLFILFFFPTLYWTSVFRGLYFGSHFIPKPSWDLQTHSPVHRTSISAHGGFPGHRQEHPRTEFHINPAAVGFKVEQKRSCGSSFRQRCSVLQSAQADWRGPVFDGFFFYLLI